MGYYPRLRDLREDRDLSIRKLAGLTNDPTPRSDNKKSK